ncbi:Hypothetical protein POVR1_LOCUS329 [uncultured virus]|nr:Hypothetical protein POVR1_LOCUS329 [uncultured virus]
MEKVLRIYHESIGTMIPHRPLTTMLAEWYLESQSKIVFTLSVGYGLIPMIYRSDDCLKSDDRRVARVSRNMMLQSIDEVNDEDLRSESFIIHYGIVHYGIISDDSVDQVYSIHPFPDSIEYKLTSWRFHQPSKRSSIYQCRRYDFHRDNCEIFNQWSKRYERSLILTPEILQSFDPFFEIYVISKRNQRGFVSLVIGRQENLKFEGSSRLYLKIVYSLCDQDHVDLSEVLSSVSDMSDKPLAGYSVGLTTLEKLDNINFTLTPVSIYTSFKITSEVNLMIM